MPTLLFALLFLLLAGRTAPAGPPPEAPPDTRTLSPYFFVHSDDPSTDRLPLKATAAKVHIAGVIARVAVTQVYRNEGKRALEAIYIFPGSTRAAVHGMTMTIGERVIVARIEERQEARRQYERARESGQSASLLEQQRPNVFQMNVANILPGDEIKVELVYSELLVPERGVYEFVYPTVVGPRYSTTEAATAPESEHWVQNPYRRQGDADPTRFDFSASISGGMALERVTSPSHALKIAYPSATRAVLTLGDEGATANKDLVIRYQLADQRIETGLLLYEAGGERFFLCLVEPPRRFTSALVPPREYVFIVDVSGSMHGFPLETTKAVLRKLMAGLQPDDSFNVLFFSGGSYVLSPASLPATEANKSRALQEIERQAGGGGTELLPALRRAFDLPRARRDVARTIVIATDGYVNVEREAFGLVRDRLDDASVFAFGIGSSVNRHLIEGLARAGRGLPFVVLGPGEAPRAAARFLEYIESPLLTDIQVSTPGFEAYDLEPGTVPDLFAERPLVLAGKYRGEPKGEIVITGYTGEGRFERRLKVDRGRAVAGAEALRYLWARERLAVLSDFAALPGFEGPGGDGAPDAAEVARKNAVTKLGLEYNLLTEFTSFVAIDQRRRGDGRLETVKQPLPLPEGVSDLAVGSVGGIAKMQVAAESMSFAGGKPPADRARGGIVSTAPVQAPPPPAPPAPRVRLIQSQVTGRPVRVETVIEAVRRALAAGGCSATPSALRLRLVFDANGAVSSVEPAAGRATRAAAIPACVRQALQGLRLPGVTGGSAIVEVGW